MDYLKQANRQSSEVNEMAVSNPKPVEISSGIWSVEGGINKFTVNIPSEPVDNDLDGVIIIASTAGDPAYPADVFYKGPWQEFIVIDTDSNNNALLPNTIYRVGVAAYDEFGSGAADVDFGSTTKDTVTLQVVADDIATDAVVTDKVQDSAITDAKISSLTANKITAGTITGSTLRTAASGKRFEVSTVDNEAHFYDADDNEIASIGFRDFGAQDYSVGVFGDPDNYTVGGSPLRGISAFGFRHGGRFWGPTAGVEGNSETTGVSGLGDFAGVQGQNTAANGYGVYGFSDKNDGADGVAGRFRNTDTSGGNRNDATTLLVEQMSQTSYADVVFIDASNAVYGDTVGLKIEMDSTYPTTKKAIEIAEGVSDLSGGPVYFKSYTVATLPSASVAGGMIYVSDETGGAVMAFSDGTNWRRVTDRSVVA